VSGRDAGRAAAALAANRALLTGDGLPIHNRFVVG
jgi:hypothetical protein